MYNVHTNAQSIFNIQLKWCSSFCLAFSFWNEMNAKRKTNLSPSMNSMSSKMKGKKHQAFAKNKWKRNMMLNGSDEWSDRYLKWIHWELNKQWEKVLCMRSHFYNDFTIDKTNNIFSFNFFFSILITIEIRFSHSIFCLNENDFQFGRSYQQNTAHST